MVQTIPSQSFCFMQYVSKFTRIYVTTSYSMSLLRQWITADLVVQEVTSKRRNSHNQVWKDPLILRRLMIRYCKLKQAWTVQKGIEKLLNVVSWNNSNCKKRNWLLAYTEHAVILLKANLQNMPLRRFCMHTPRPLNELKPKSACFLYPYSIVNGGEQVDKGKSQENGILIFGKELIQKRLLTTIV